MRAVDPMAWGPRLWDPRLWRRHYLSTVFPTDAGRLQPAATYFFTFSAMPQPAAGPKSPIAHILLLLKLLEYQQESHLRWARI